MNVDKDLESDEAILDDYCLRVVKEALRRIHEKEIETCLSLLDRYIPDNPTISREDLKRLFLENPPGKGHHYIIQQHDAPRAGLHWDLRLQTSLGKTMSFAFPKGLQGTKGGAPRLAVETTLHPYYYSLMEFGNPHHGNHIMWDCGTYEILPSNPQAKDDDTSGEDDSQESQTIASQEESLEQAYHTGMIRVLLRGARLKHYVLRLSLENLHRPLGAVFSWERLPNLRRPLDAGSQRHWLAYRGRGTEDLFINEGREDSRNVSVITGRKGSEVMKDDGFEGWTPRRGWMPAM